MKTTGITIMPEYIQSEGIEAILNRCEQAGIRQIATSPYYMHEAEEGCGYREPPIDAGSGKVRLFNVWATWCGPCVEEMPDLSDISRKFSRREFELITISLDLPNEKEKVETFLGKHRIVMSDKLRKTVEAEGRKTNNYIFSGANTDELAEALDPKWPGPVPYTVLVDESGKVLYRVSGMIDPVKVKNAILDKMGNYHSVQMKR